MTICYVAKHFVIYRVAQKVGHLTMYRSLLLVKTVNDARFFSLNLSVEEV